MFKAVAVVGTRPSDEIMLLENLIPVLRRRGLKVGVAINRVISGEEKARNDEVRRCVRAGAFQVFVARGKEFGFHNKRGTLTPLERVAARYFSSVDILLASGYYEPVPRIEVCLDDHPGRLNELEPSRLLAVVLKTPNPGLPVPSFALTRLEKLADLLT